MKKKQARPAITAAIYEVVDNQLRDGNPPVTKETYDRLAASGIADPEIRRLIANVLVLEIHDMLKEKKNFNLERYTAALRKLPEIDF